MKFAKLLCPLLANTEAFGDTDKSSIGIPKIGEDLTVSCEGILLSLSHSLCLWSGIHGPETYILIVFHLRWLKIKWIHAVTQISITQFSNHLEWNSSKLQFLASWLTFCPPINDSLLRTKPFIPQKHNVTVWCSSTLPKDLQNVQ